MSAKEKVGIGEGRKRFSPTGSPWRALLMKPWPLFLPQSEESLIPISPSVSRPASYNWVGTIPASLLDPPYRIL